MSAELDAETRALVDVLKASPTLRAVAHERLRQIEVERFGALHDDGHAAAELAHASASYLGTADLQVKHGAVPACFIPRIWPWGRDWWKPSADQFRNRVKGLALGVAEGDRLKRMGAPKP